MLPSALVSAKRTPIGSDWTKGLGTWFESYVRVSVCDRRVLHRSCSHCTWLGIKWLRVMGVVFVVFSISTDHHSWSDL